MYIHGFPAGVFCCFGTYSRSAVNNYFVQMWDTLCFSSTLLSADTTFHTLRVSHKITTVSKLGISAN